MVKKYRKRLDPNENKGPYEYNIITLCDGGNKHHVIRRRNTDFHFEGKHVTESSIYLMQRGLFGMISDRFRGIKCRFQVIFKEGENTAVNAGSYSGDTKITAGILKLVKNSNVVKNAMAELFKTQVPVRKWLFVVIVGVVITVVAVVFITGIDIGGLLGGR